MKRLTRTGQSIVDKAEELAAEYEARYKGCAQCTFFAVIDALRWGGLELIAANVEDKFYPAVSVLTAGVCMTGEGTCGAVAGGAMAMGLALGVSRDRADVAAGRHAAAAIRESLLERCYLEYRSILCKDIQRKYFGKAWNLADDDMAHEFLSITRGCIIVRTAKLVARSILDEYEKETLGASVQG